MMIIRLVMIGSRYIGQGFTVPPTATERLKQRRGIGKARALRLHQSDARLLVGALRIEQRQIAYRAQLVLPRRKLERLARQRFGVGLRLERQGIQIQRAQGIGDVLKRGQDGRLVLRCSLVVGRNRSAALGGQSTAVEERLQQSGRNAPETAAGTEQLARL